MVRADRFDSTLDRVLLLDDASPAARSNRKLSSVRFITLIRYFYDLHVRSRARTALAMCPMRQGQQRTLVNTRRVTSAAR